MNVYFVSAGEVTEYDHAYPPIDPPETYFLVELVAAPTRRAATYAVWKKHQRLLGDLIEQHWQTQKVAEKEIPAGILDHDDELWHDPKLPQPGEVRVCPYF